MANEMERVLGKEIDRSKEIPGTIAKPGTAVVYFSDDRKHSFDEQFECLTRYVKPRRAKVGGKISQRCRLWLPDGTLLHPVRYHGDLEGWRSDIEIGAKQNGHLLATIDGTNIAISDGRVISLQDCKVQFDDEASS